MRAELRDIAQETVDLVQRGSYQSPAGRTVSFAAEVAAAVAGTRLYLPTDPVPAPAPAASLVVRVTNESTLAAAQRYAADGDGGEVAALVFASARSPGGGFLNGAQAQEESVARCSALYACQTAVPDFYSYHRDHPDPRYTDRVIYSPAVPTFRDDAGQLLDQPYLVTYLTAAAPNLSAMRNQQRAIEDVPAVLHRRADRVLRIAAANGHRRLVLGAWGCGVFGNDPATVADAFVTALQHNPCFTEVTFAVLDRPDGRTYTAFSRVFG